jgi:hypothetical protein
LILTSKHQVLTENQTVTLPKLLYSGTAFAILQLHTKPANFTYCIIFEENSDEKLLPEAQEI